MEDEKIFVEKEIEKLNQLVEETYEKHLNLGKENQELLDKVQSFSKEGEFYKGEAMKKSNELREIQFNFENERENMLNEMKNIELTYKEKFDYQRKEFKEFEERLYEESEHKQQNLSDALEKEKSNYEEKTLEFANSNKEMLKQLEKVFENEEILREKVENKRKIKDQTILQEKSIRIALKELQEELMIGRTTGYVSKTNELLKNSISKRNKTKMND